MNKTLCSALMSTALLCTPAWGSDLDDGIAIDEPVNDSVQVDTNTIFTVVHAKTKARAQSSGSSTDTVTADGNGLGNINIGAGVDLSGATIINLSDNENSTVISE